MRALLLDSAAAVVLTVFTQYEVWSSVGAEPLYTAQAACFAVITLSVALWRRLPPLGLALAVSALTVQTAVLGEAPVVGGLLALLLLTYGVAAEASLRPALLGLTVLALGVIAEPVADPRDRSVGDAIGNAAIFGVVWSTGRLVRRLRYRNASWQRHARDLETEREREVRLAVADERQRIARELHDVVAHSVGVMVLQAGAARQLLSVEPERARPPLLLVEDVGREALGELHRVVQVLRRPDEGSPAPVGLDQLIQQMSRSGSGCRCRSPGSVEDSPPGST